MVGIPRIQRQQVPVGNVPPAVQAPTRTAAGRGQQILGDTLQDIGFRGIDRQNRAVVAQAEAAARRVSLEAFNGSKDTPGLDQMRGPVYLEAAPRVLEGLDKEWQRINGALTPQQQAMLAPRLEQIRTSAQINVQGKSAQVAERIAQAAYANNLQSMHAAALDAAGAVTFNPVSGELDLSAVERVLSGDGSGRPGYGGADEAIKDYAYDNAHLLDVPVAEWVETAQADFRSDVHAQAINQALEDGDPDGARRYFQQVRDDMTDADRELAERDVGRATEALDAEAVAREVLGGQPPLLTNDKAAEAEQLGVEYTTEAARHAAGRAEALERGGPKALDAYEAAYQQQQKQIKAAYDEQLSTVTQFIYENGGDFAAAEKAFPALMSEFFKPQDVAELEKTANTLRYGPDSKVVRLTLQKLANMRLNNPDKYLNLTRSDKLAILGALGRDEYQKWEADYAKDLKSGGQLAPEIRGLLGALAEDAGFDEVETARLGAAAQQAKLDYEAGGKAMPFDEQQRVAENLVREQFFLHGLPVDTDAPLYRAGAEELLDDLELHPQLAAANRDELRELLGREPSDLEVAGHVLAKLPLYGTATAGGAGGLEPLPLLEEQVPVEVRKRREQMNEAEAAEALRQAIQRGEAPPPSQLDIEQLLGGP